MDAYNLHTGFNMYPCVPWAVAMVTPGLTAGRTVDMQNIYEHMYVCIYMYVYMCMYAYICVCMHIYVCIYMYVYICMYIYVCIYIYVHTYSKMV